MVSPLYGYSIDEIISGVPNMTTKPEESLIEFKFEAKPVKAPLFKISEVKPMPMIAAPSAYAPLLEYSYVNTPADNYMMLGIQLALEVPLDFISVDVTLSPETEYSYDEFDRFTMIIDEGTFNAEEHEQKDRSHSG